jgi:hypothetical protein
MSATGMRKYFNSNPWSRVGKWLSKVDHFHIAQPLSTNLSSDLR